MTNDLEHAKPKPNFKGLRLGKKTIQALEAMAYEGISLHVAADRFEMRRDHLRRSFDSPQVRARYNQIVGHIRENSAQDAFLRMVDLAQNATSEHVRADANKWLAGVDGISPVQKVQGQHHHNVQFGGFEYEEPETKTVNHDAQKSKPTD